MKLAKYNCATGLVNVLYTHGDLIVRTSTISDMVFVDSLQKQNSFALGFIQDTIWRKYVWGVSATSWC